MRYKDPSLKKWVGVRVEQLENPYWIGKGSTSGHVGRYLKGHPFMRSETSHTHPGITGTIYCIVGPSSVWITNMKWSSQREIMRPSARSKAPNKNGRWNRDTPPSRSFLWNKWVDVDRKGPVIDEAMRILNYSTRENNNVTNGLTPRIMGKRGLRDKHITTLIRAQSAWLTSQ